MAALVIVHYHLRTGGVSRVIETASKCLSALGIQHLILSSSPSSLRPSLPCIEVPELCYSDTSDQTSPRELFQKIKTIATERLGKQTLVWQFHNHSLGKSELVSRLVSLMAQEGERLLLQIHDFAEDGRPGNYQHVDSIPFLYPIADQIHYLFLNSRDRQRMQMIGLAVSQASVLPNCCEAVECEWKRSTRSPLVLYPVRAMRRKNLGELCLLAAHSKKEITFAVGLAPEGKEWAQIYKHWVQVSKKHQLNVLFDVSDKISPAEGVSPTFQSWQTHATHFITTSVAEGFGMAFLEPQFFDKPLIGRDLPEITQDLKANGLNYPSLYTRLLVHESWIDIQSLQALLETALTSSRRAYGHATTQQDYDRALKAMMHDGDHYDFGQLPEQIQTDILEKALTASSQYEILAEVEGARIPLKDWIDSTLQATLLPQAQSGLDQYGAIQYGEALAAHFLRIAQIDLSETRALSPQKVLDAFLSPESFHFLRT